MAAAAGHYREQAAKMRRFADEADDADDRRNFNGLAAEYDRLAQRAEHRQRPTSSSAPELKKRP